MIKQFMSGFKRFGYFPSTLALIGSLVVVPVGAAGGAITLPTGAFSPCSVSATPYCIEAVAVQPAGTSTLINLQWVPSGTPGPAVSRDEGVTAGKELTGRWTAEGAFEGENYDGIYLDVKQANAFVPWIFADAKPTYSPAGAVKLAATPANTNYAVDLNPDAAISITLQVSNFEPGMTFGVGTDGVVTYTPGSSGNKLSFFAYPVKVPLAKSTRDCTGDNGVAAALVAQHYTVFIPKNDDKGYGIDGSTGRLYVGSNGICKLSSPTWVKESKTFNYRASGPKLSPDSKDINKGFYYASIPFADAKALWGLENPKDAASALVVSIKTNAGGSSGAASLVSVKNEHIVISVSGFEFPDPSVDISLNPSYNSKGAVSGANNTAGGVKGENNMSLSGGGAKESKMKTITCTKGNKTRKVSNVKPVCPKGWKKA